MRLDDQTGSKLKLDRQSSHDTLLAHDSKLELKKLSLQKVLADK